MARIIAEVFVPEVFQSADDMAKGLGLEMVPAWMQLGSPSPRMVETDRLHRVDQSIAKQLGDSIALNARMKAEHSARVTELLEHNNKLEERARAAERLVTAQRTTILMLSGEDVMR